MQGKGYIFICDDDELFLKRLEKEIADWIEKEGENCALKIYSKGGELVSDIEEEAGLYMLDIDMPDVPGLQLAEQIRQKDSRATIIFVSNHEEMVFEAIHYAPFRFIRKECLGEELPEALMAWRKSWEHHDSLMEIVTRQGIVYVQTEDILYMESNRHYLTVYCMNGKYEVRGKLSDYEKRLNGKGFVRANIGYLINCRYVRALRSGKVELTSGKEITIARGRYEDVKHTYMEYVREKGKWNS